VPRLDESSAFFAIGTRLLILVLFTSLRDVYFSQTLKDDLNTCFVFPKGFIFGASLISS